MQQTFLERYELAVVGCGGIGSAVLYHASQRSRSVLGIEQFADAHDRGSSHGQTRIIRQAYFEHPNYVPLLLEAYQEWSQLEKSLDRKLYFETGLLQVGLPTGSVVSGVLRSASEHHLDVEQWNRTELERRYPVFKIPEGHEGVFEKKGGYLLVEPCVQAHLDGARGNEVHLSNQTELLRIKHLPDFVELETTHGFVRAKRVVITVGAWLGRWLQSESQPLYVLRKHLHWFSAEDQRLAHVDQCPIFLFESEKGCFYGFPNLDKKGMKVAEHSRGELVEDPGNVNRSLDPNDLSRVKEFLSETFEGRFQHLSHSVCMYTMTKDQNFIIDQHPEDPRILIAGGFSGHGFKFASVLGKLISNWSFDNQRDPRLDFLSLRRP